MFEKIVAYIDVRENRQKLILVLGRFAVMGGLLISALILLATFCR